MDLQLADQLCTKYYNLYSAAKLSESRTKLLMTFSTQVKEMLAMAMPPPMMAPTGEPIAVPQAPPVSDMLPVAPQT